MGNTLTGTPAQTHTQHTRTCTHRHPQPYEPWSRASTHTPMPHLPANPHIHAQTCPVAVLCKALDLAEMGDDPHTDAMVVCGAHKRALMVGDRMTAAMGCVDRFQLASTSTLPAMPNSSSSMSCHVQGRNSKAVSVSTCCMAEVDSPSCVFAATNSCKGQ